MEVVSEAWHQTLQRQESGLSFMRNRPRQVMAYGAFTGASQGSTGTTGSSNLEPWNSTRSAKAETLMALDGCAGISHTFYWMNLEPIAPTGGIHTYDWTAVDYALAEIAHYPGAKVFFRVNSGGPSAPNWIMGGATNRLANTVSSGSTITLQAGVAPPNLSTQCYLDGPTGQQEGPFVTSALAGQQFSISPSTVGNAHLAGGVVEWGKQPAAWVNNQGGGWKSGDMLIAPTGAVNVLGLAGGNLVYVATMDIPQFSYGTGTSAAANWQLFLAANALVEVVQFANGDWMPVTWDLVYQSHRFAFIQAFGARYNGHPLVDKIQMAGAGYLGEQTLHSSDTFWQTVSSWLPHGYNDWTYIQVWKAFIDAYAAAFPNKALCLDIDEPFGAVGPGGAAWPTAFAPAAACGTLSTQVVNCTTTTYSPRTDTVSGVTNENTTFTDVTATSFDVGKRVTGLTGLSADRFVGTVNTSTNLVQLSLSPTTMQACPSNVISGTSATFTNDLKTGMLVSGQDIPANSFVGYVTLNTKFTLSSGQGVQGTFTSATSLLGTDTTASWTPGQFVGWKVYSGVAGASTGTITANTATVLTVTWSGGTPTSPNLQYSICQDVSATGTHPTITLQFNSTSRVDAGCTFTSGQPVIGDTSISFADCGKLVAGTGIPVGTAFVGAVDLVGKTFRLSSSRFSQVDINTIGAGPQNLTLAFDGLAYNVPSANGGIIKRAIVGSNQSGSLASDVYSGGTPIIGYTGLTYPNRIYVQQNGLTQQDLNALPAGRYRQIIAGSSPTAVGNPNAVIMNAGSGYQPHNGANTVPNINSMLKVMFDDGCAYIELYANDVVTGASDVALLAAGTRP